MTLLELLATVAILAIVLGYGVPSLASFFDAKRLTGAAEQIYSHMQQARLESIARSTTIFARFDADGDASWQYGISHRDACDIGQADPTAANACVLVVSDGDANVDPGDGSADTGDLVLMRFEGSAHGGVTADIAAFGSGGDQIEFDPVRGTTSRGEIHLTSPDGKQLHVRIGLLGQIRVCTPDASVINYTGC